MVFLTAHKTGTMRMCITCTILPWTPWQAQLTAESLWLHVVFKRHKIMSAWLVYTSLYIRFVSHVSWWVCHSETTYLRWGQQRWLISRWGLHNFHSRLYIWLWALKLGTKGEQVCFKTCSHHRAWRQCLDCWLSLVKMILSTIYNAPYLIVILQGFVNVSVWDLP